MLNTRSISILALIVFLVTVTAGVGAQDSNVLRVGMNAPVVLDPALQSNDPEIALNLAIYDYLVDIQPDGAIDPNLASEWQISEDSLTYTFTLLDGVTFHDGSAFDSADVVYTFERLVEVQSPALGLLGSFEVSAPDAATVVFTLAEVNADFLYGVGSRWASVLPEGLTEPNVLAEGDNPYVNFNGTGPFVIEEFSPGSRASFAANPNYWQDSAPMLDGMEHIYIDDPIAQVDALLSGELDFIFKVPRTQISRIEETEGITLLERPTAQHAVIRLRTDEGPGAEVAVRQALKYATDREQLNDVLLEGRGIIGNNDPIGPVYGQFYDANIENPTYDPATACQLLTEGGYPDGLELTLFIPNALEYPDMAALLQQQWAETGCINVDIQVREENLYYDTSNPENYFDVTLGLTGWGSRPIPQQYLQEAYTTDAPFNESRWSDAELDALVAEARMTTDPAARAEIYSQIAQIFAERGPIIVPYFAPMIGAASERVQGLDMDPFPGLTDYRTVSLAG